MSQSIIYNDSVHTDLITVLSYINNITKGMGVTPCPIDDYELEHKVLNSMRQDFPYKNGLDHANVFKKVGYFMAHFIAIAPIKSPFPANLVGKTIVNMRNHQNAIIALLIAIESLHGATVINDERGELTLENRIQISQHSLTDIIDAIREASITGHTKVFTVLLEQMAYKSNPQCQNDLVDF